MMVLIHVTHPGSGVKAMPHFEATRVDRATRLTWLHPADLWSSEQENQMHPENYAKGRVKRFGEEIRVNEYWGLNPDDLPQVGDFVLLKTRAHELIEVIPSRSKPDTIRYRAIIRRLDEVPANARTFTSESNIQNY